MHAKKLIIERDIIILGTAVLATILPSLVNGGNLFGIVYYHLDHPQ